MSDRDDTLIAVIAILGLFGLIAFLAYLSSKQQPTSQPAVTAMPRTISAKEMDEARQLLKVVRAYGYW